MLPALLGGLIGAIVLDAVGRVWAAGWILSGIVAIVAVYTPGAHAGARTGGIIAGVVWIALGLFFSLIGRGFDRAAGKSKPAQPAGPPPG